MSRNKSSTRKAIASDEISRLIRGDKTALERLAREGGNMPKEATQTVLADARQVPNAMMPAGLSREDLQKMMNGDLMTLTQLAYQNSALGNEAKGLVQEMANHPELAKAFLSGQAQSEAQQERFQTVNGASRGIGSRPTEERGGGGKEKEPWWMAHGPGLGRVLFGSGGRGAGNLMPSVGGGGAGGGAGGGGAGEGGGGAGGGKVAKKDKKGNPTLPKLEGGGEGTLVAKND